ncbi:hypothetical protein DH2020_013073 [Rehmannia glutinosa]|uniref:Uncharacterized protein n=1 Tax=Rehmannia glutinosa TaxID=99300 RepID=A0ABR0X4C5_REHGL
MSKPRTTNYISFEDRHLCNVFLDISQDPIVGTNRTERTSAKRIEDKYNSGKPSSNIQDHNQRSLQCRMQTILKDVRKFNGCLQQIEYLNPSGANEQILLECANELLMQQKGYSGGFKFDHVCSSNGYMSQSDTQSLESLTSASPSPTSCYLNLSHDNVGGTSLGRPTGAKEPKSKSKKDDRISVVVDALRDQNRQLVGILKNKPTDREQSYRLQMKSAFKILENSELVYGRTNTLYNEH